VENRLKALYQIQLIDDQLDELEELRGDLPSIVRELREKIEVLDNQKGEQQKIQKDAKIKINDNEDELQKSKENQKKYKAQLHSVRTNREYDALTKEIDFAEEQLTKLTAENKALEDSIEKAKRIAAEFEPLVEEVNIDLAEKEEELKDIVKVNEKEEEKLRSDRSKVETKVKKPDYEVYMRIRKAKKGKAVVPVKRSACSGCYTIVPPQKQLEIRQSKKLHFCESCGRILISAELAERADVI